MKIERHKNSQPDDWDAAPTKGIKQAGTVPVADIVVPQPVNPTDVIIPQVPVADAAKPAERTKAEEDARYYGVYTDLPSGMTFYDFDLLSVRPYALTELIKLGAATKSGKIRYIVEAVGATIDRPVMSLTMADFYFLCFWLRLMSYKTKPFTVYWGCEEPDHFRQVMDEKRDDEGKLLADEASLQNETLMTRSDLVVEPIDSAKLAPIATELTQHGIALYMPSVADFLETVETGENWNDEQVFLAQYAALLHVHHGRKLIDRIKYLDSIAKQANGVDILELLDQARAIIQPAGVVERVKATCKHCGGVQEVTLSVDLLSFFPFGN